MPRAVDDLVARLPILEPARASIEKAVALSAVAIRAGGKLLICGNGGSAADAGHLVGDLMKGFMSRRPIPDSDRDRLEALAGDRGLDIAKSLQGSLPAISLASETALLTAIANDIKFDMVFAQQVSGLGRMDDVLVAISTSGTSPNVVNAAITARLRSMTVISLTAGDGGELTALSDVAILVPADTVYEIQELHVAVYHAIALSLEQEFFGSAPRSVGH